MPCMYPVLLYYVAYFKLAYLKSTHLELSNEVQLVHIEQCVLPSLKTNGQSSVWYSTLSLDSEPKVKELFPMVPQCQHNFLCLFHVCPSLKHTWQPSLFSKESQFRGVSPDFSPFPPSFEYHSIFDKNWPKIMIFYSDNTLLRRVSGVSVINKQSENDHFKA